MYEIIDYHGYNLTHNLYLNVKYKLEGNIVAPNSTEAWREKKDKTKWIEVVNVNGLIINGGGQIDGRGSVWWKDCHVSHQYFIFIISSSQNDLQYVCPTSYHVDCLLSIKTCHIN
ncbi:putative polygalacturonase [Lupinus albus]|uniref:Putative polygalacturonase n=1 Tax=Lupinus albus TaxID=3870 RepID=A0A6A4Q2P4_LUPAL|nr:putative polygalacturonase [Lupinus albus]